MSTMEPVFWALCISILVRDYVSAVQHNYEISAADQCCCASADQDHCALGQNIGIIDLMLHDPRFVAVRKGWNISIECRNKNALENSSFSWSLTHSNGSVTNCLPDSYISMHENYLILTKIQKHHSGTYFCKFNTSEGEKTSPCGTELVVVDCGNPVAAKSRNTMKDAIIMIQTILIVLFLLVPGIMLMEMNKKRSMKIEDHTYEGLEAYQTATYEDIQNVRVLSAKSMEAEHPCVQ
ncbi:B-cell antigen receptor complex-associated protein beta chain isoform X2 [Pseudophryne corroboree]|uniref:B-cell antigen receptor complex-associated protein beta chain isoform X2 n=1 Tax=Pseudophryne corroboree TaxID=495146 RepID=UPI003081F65E